MSKCVRHTQYGLCVLPTGVAVVLMLKLYSVLSLCRTMMSKYSHYAQYGGLCVLPTGVAVAPMLTLWTVCINA